jgi:hypothetical protein
MRIRSLVLLLALALGVAGCGNAGAQVGARSEPTSASVPAVEPKSASVPAIDRYELYTHCGISEAKVGSDFYQASPALNDGEGNPPAGWGNPYQVGTMTVHDDGTAQFVAPGGLKATFKIRRGATDWITICS